MKFEERVKEMSEEFNKILQNAELRRDLLIEYYKKEGIHNDEECKHFAEKDVLNYIKKKITASVKYNWYHHY